jgi:hypothetical protein
MAIKNYTTSIKIEKTIMEIENILSSHGASRIMKMYTEGIPSAVAFSFILNPNTDKMHELNFKLPMREDKIFQVFKNQHREGIIPNKLCNLEQARRTGWRIIKDWIDSQMALLEIEIVKFEEIFLPYMYDIQKDQTMFEKLQDKKFLLENKNTT